ncbi:hypothetical protein GCM10025867_47500 (plasmid) [Frondihabitans sucicola]|uniref:Uncharacterized protein n=1 Tax=Frondihabitans sucicola TaxID=1268041 RepID=A0ABN6Y608_9MICO|nr:hypothetical protein [Frondihabitans sucicola]BDZ52509.1 hypothetical protein GCM10025867_47500 [Frondihabitans sucicola]
MRGRAAAALVGVALLAGLTGCSLAPRHQVDQPLTGSALQAKVCADGDGAVQAVELGGISTRWVANAVVDNTTAAQPIHDVAAAAAANPDDPAARDQLAAWVRATCAS